MESMEYGDLDNEKWRPGKKTKQYTCSHGDQGTGKYKTWSRSDMENRVQENLGMEIGTPGKRKT